MKRSIKFRGWHKKDRGMIEISDLHLNEGGWSGDGSHHNELEDIHLMQYTGLKDRNGKEIYEGDIVRVISKPIFDDEEIHTENFKVKLDLNGIGFEARDGSDLMVGWAEITTEGNSIEVIGNIYATPKLLKETYDKRNKT